MGCVWWRAVRGLWCGGFRGFRPLTIPKDTIGRKTPETPPGRPRAAPTEIPRVVHPLESHPDTAGGGAVCGAGGGGPTIPGDLGFWAGT